MKPHKIQHRRRAVNLKPKMPDICSQFFRQHLPFASVSKRVLVHSLSNDHGNEFDLQDNERVGKTHFHMKG